MISKGRVIRTGLFFAIANFLLTALIGILLRYNTLIPIKALTERFWVHAHSHVGFLGWIFIALVILGFGLLLPKSAKINRRVYRLMIYLQVSIIGMLVTFPFMGYAAPSILFSTFHMVLSMVYVWMFYKYADKNELSNKFMKAGLIFMLVSGLGPLALGPIIVGGYRGTDWYDMAIYFYLHFQYNGWFTMAIFALLIKLLERSGLLISPETGKQLYRYLVIGIIMTLALSFLGFGLKIYTISIGVIGALFQLFAGFILLKLLFVKTDLRNFVVSNWAKWFFGIALFSWLLKIMMQLLSVIPVITEFAYFSRDAIMAFLHLSFLGFATCFVLGVLIKQQFLSTDSILARVGYAFLMIGIVLMELTVGLRAIPQYLSLELYKVLNSFLLFEAIVLALSIFFILFYGFILSNRAIKQRALS